MAFVPTGQGDFSAGIHRGRKAPANAVYDAVNGLIDDEGLLYRRGGSEYHSASVAASTVTDISTVYLPGPAENRVLAWGTDLYALDGSNTPVSLYADAQDITGRPVFAGGLCIWPLTPETSLGITSNRLLLYGGSLKSAAVVNQGTITLTEGSTAVTKAGGTSWATTADAGMIIEASGGGSLAIVRSVDGANALTLAYPWPEATVATATYTMHVITDWPFDGVGLIPATGDLKLGAVGQKLLMGVGNRVYESDFSTLNMFFDEDLYHDIPAAEIGGIQGVGDSALVFTSVGVWSIDNISLDAVDAFGNQQQVVRRISGDVLLWGEKGIVPWQGGGVVVPSLEDVYIMGADGTTLPVTGDPENEKIRRLYRSYTATDDYRPGFATVHRGHLFIPVLNGSTLVDVLVCRLDRGAAWTRWAGHGAPTGFATLSGRSADAQKLLGAKGTRITDLTGCLDPAADNSTDADATTSDMVIITRDYPTGGNQHGFAARLRARYELVDPGFDDFNSYDDGELPDPPWFDWTAGQKPSVSDGKVYDVGGFSDATESLMDDADGFMQITFETTLTPNTGQNFGVGIRLTANGPTANGYMFEVDGTGATFTAKLYKGSTFTTISTQTGISSTSIDGMRIVATGTLIEGYLRIDGSWTQVITATDASYSAAGYPGFWVQDPSSGADIGVDTAAWGSGAANAGVTVEYSSDQDQDDFTELTDLGEQGGGDGWATSDGSKYQWARVSKRRERIRFRLTVAGATTSFILRSLELLTRASGKQ